MKGAPSYSLKLVINYMAQWHAIDPVRLDRLRGADCKKSYVLVNAGRNEHA
jgi:hypothetical protein